MSPTTEKGVLPMLRLAADATTDVVVMVTKAADEPVNAALMAYMKELSVTGQHGFIRRTTIKCSMFFA